MRGRRGGWGQGGRRFVGTVRKENIEVMHGDVRGMAAGLEWRIAVGHRKMKDGGKDERVRSNGEEGLIENEEGEGRGVRTGCL